MFKLILIIFQLLALQFTVTASPIITYHYGLSRDNTVDSYRDSEQSRVGNYYAPDAGTTQIIRDAVSSTNAQFGNIFADLGNGAYINSDNLSDIIAQVGSNYSPEEQQLFINSILAKAVDFSSTSVVPVSPYLSNLKPALFSESDSLALNNARLKVSGALSSAINSCKDQSCSMTAIKVSQIALDNLINTNINNTLNANYLKRWGENTSAFDAGQKKFKNLIDNLDDRELKDVLDILENQKSIEEELKKTASEWDIPMDNIVEDKEASNLDKYAQDLIDLKTCLGSSANCEMSNSQDHSSEFVKEYKQLDSIYKTSKYINQSGVAPSYKESASNFLSISTDALIGGDLESSKQFEEIATAIVDIGLGLLPVVGVGKDVYELFTGKNLVTGEELSTFERGLAAVGILTAGGSHYIQTAGKILSKSARVSEEVIKAGEKVIHSAQKAGLFEGNKLKNLKANSSFETVKSFFRTLDKSNIPLPVKKSLVKSFDLKSIEKEIVTKDLFVYRWHNNDAVASRFGRFVSDTPLTDKEMARKLLALPDDNKMLFFEKFKIKKGTEIYKGTVAPLNGYTGGGSQIFITGENIEDILTPIIN